MKRLALILAVMACACGLVWGQDKAPATPASTTVWPATSTATPAPKVPATPAIWKVKGAHGTVYLFGSIHVMKPNVDWQSEHVKSAFDSSDVVYLEVANPTDTMAAASLAAQFGMDQAHPLSTKLSKDDVDLLDTAAKSMGLPGEAMFEPMQPWLVSVTISVLPMIKAGYAPNSGIDTTLLGQTKGSQKQVKGFETIADQIHFLADLPTEQQIQMLHKELTEMDKSTTEMNQMVDAWEHGDVDTIAKMENDELASKYPIQYKRLVVDRNQKWAATLNGLLNDKDTGTVFVVVGAAHLAGPDSVVKLLEKNGWKVERE